MFSSWTSFFSFFFYFLCSIFLCVCVRARARAHAYYALARTAALQLALSEFPMRMIDVWVADEGGLRERCVKFAGAPQITGTSEDCISNKRDKMSEAFEFVVFQQLQFCELFCTKKTKCDLWYTLYA